MKDPKGSTYYLQNNDEGTFSVISQPERSFCSPLEATRLCGRAVSRRNFLLELHALKTLPSAIIDYNAWGIKLLFFDQCHLLSVNP